MSWVTVSVLMCMCRVCKFIALWSQDLLSVLFLFTAPLCVCVSARPFWLLEPQDVEIGVGGTAEFNCLAKSVPAPQYFWFVNGVPLECKCCEDVWPLPICACQHSHCSFFMQLWWESFYCFVNCEGQSHKTVSIDHNLWRVSQTSVIHLPA